MNDPFLSARRKLARAQFHITELKREIDAFDKSNPYEMFVESNPNTPNEEIHKIKLTRPVPNCSEIAGDAVNNLRESLDHVAFAVARPPRKNCYFPFGSPENFERSGRGNCKHLPDEIITFFRSFKPYEGGDDLLWSLNQIAVANKHTTLVDFAISGTRAEQATVRHSPEAAFWIAFPPFRWDHTKQEAIIARSSTLNEGPHYTQFEHRITLFVSFRDIEIISNQEATRVLDALASKIEGILLATEAEARRLGVVA